MDIAEELSLAGQVIAMIAEMDDIAPCK